MEFKYFMSIPDACKYTGLSMYYLRNGCKAGTIAHIKTGNKYLINIPLLLEQHKIPNEYIKKEL